MHEVEAPHLVGSRRLEQLLLEAGRKPLLRPTTAIEPERRVNPVDPLVIPPVPCQAKPVVGLPEVDQRELGIPLLEPGVLDLELLDPLNSLAERPPYLAFQL